MQQLIQVRRTTAAAMLSAALLISAASAQSFNWKQASGQGITVMLNQHPYQAAIVKKIKAFTALTGVTVDYTVTPEENYFDKVSSALKAKDGSADVFMTGIYQSWDYATAGQMEPLDAYMNSGKLTEGVWNQKDFFPGVLNAGKWNLKLGSQTGSGSQWVLPLGFESNTLSYNKNTSTPTASRFLRPSASWRRSPNSSKAGTAPALTAWRCAAP